jgi:acetylglutamate/LysW-gamma-L-alpha-aminoadipate kinase
MLIIKIGGGETINLKGTIEDLAELDDPCIIVHGANAARDRLTKRLGLQKTVLTSVKGYQSVFSDDEALELIMMSYAGLQNKRIVELCQRQGINAIGLCGLDGRLIQGRRNKGIRVKEGPKVFIKRDRSGKPKSVNRSLLKLLLDNGYTPVLSIPIADEDGVAINSENDDIVASLQRTFQAALIVQLIEAPGYLRDPHNETTVIPHLAPLDLARLDAESEGRMRRKIYALRTLFEHGPARVVIADGRAAHPLRDALAGKGTVIE